MHFEKVCNYYSYCLVKRSMCLQKVHHLKLCKYDIVCHSFLSLNSQLQFSSATLNIIKNKAAKYLLGLQLIHMHFIMTAECFSSTQRTILPFIMKFHEMRKKKKKKHQ